MRKRVRRAEKIPPVKKPTQILLDENFLLCASGQSCDSTQCGDEDDERERRALLALLLAYEANTSLVLDDGDANQVITFYYKKYNLLSRPVKNTLSKWLNGRGGRITRMTPAKINPKAIKECNLKPNTLDPLLCQLAIACRGTAPVWTLDSDFWCAGRFHPEIRPTCPKDALDSLK